MMEGRDRSFPLNAWLEEAGLASLDASTAHRFEEYLALILRWNRRVNLTAVRDPEEILGRHFVESIFCARALPAGIGALLDFGSGAGFPGIPIALCRPEITVTLAESNGKKAGFLGEAARTLGLGSRVYAGRAETLTQTFDCVVLRAVDCMELATWAGAQRVNAGGWLALMTTFGDTERLQRAAGDGFSWGEPSKIPNSEQRVLALGRRLVVPV